MIIIVGLTGERCWKARVSSRQAGCFQRGTETRAHGGPWELSLVLKGLSPSVSDSRDLHGLHTRERARKGVIYCAPAACLAPPPGCLQPCLTSTGGDYLALGHCLAHALPSCSLSPWCQALPRRPLSSGPQHIWPGVGSSPDPHPAACQVTVQLCTS